MRGGIRVFSEMEAEEQEMRRCCHHLHQQGVVTWWLDSCVVLILTLEGIYFRWTKPKPATTEAMDQTAGVQNSLCRLRGVCFAENRQHNFFPKDSPRGCDSGGNHPNFCEAQLLFSIVEPTETYSIVKALASAHSCAMFTLKYCSAKYNFIKGKPHL